MKADAADFLKRLRRGPVSHQDAAKRYGPYAFGAIKRHLAAQGHIIQTRYPASGTVYELARDADDQIKFEGAA